MNEERADWLAAEAEYLAERPIDGSIPRKQLWGEDTIALRAYKKYRARALRDLWRTPPATAAFHL